MGSFGIGKILIDSAVEIYSERERDVSYSSLQASQGILKDSTSIKNN